VSGQKGENMKIKILILLSCLALFSYSFADPPSSASYTLVQRGFLAGNPNQASPPSSAGFELKENSILGIANDVVNSTGFLHYPGFLQPTNDAPTIILPDDFTFLEDGNLIVDFAPFINDINGDIVTITVTGNTDVLVDIQDFMVTFSATPDWNGMETLTFTANDNMDRAIASDDVNVYVLYMNDAPVVATPIADFSFDEDTVDTSIDLNTVFDDVDIIYGDELTFSYSGNTNIGIDITGGLVTLTPVPDWFGMEIITFTATDDSLESVFDEVEITVDNVNDPPVINFPANFTFLEDESETYDFTQYISDIDNTMAELTLTWVGNTNIDVALVNWDVTFSSNVPNWHGSEDITFTVDDNSDRITFSVNPGLSSGLDNSESDSHIQRERTNSSRTRDQVSEMITVYCISVNDPPTIVLPDEFTFEEDIYLIEDFEQYIYDVDLDDLTLTVTGNDSIEVDITNFIVIFTAEPDWNGTETITFIVDDNVTRATAEDSVDVVVTPVNDPPVLISWFPTALVFTVVEDTTIAFSIEVEDVDSELTYSWQVNGEPQTEITNTLVYEFTEPGDYTLEVEASDGEYQVDTTWQVHVEEGSDTDPVIIPQITKLQQNIPNPFNPETTIHYSMKDAGRVKIEIFNIKGEKIRTLVNEYKNIGFHSTIWNGKDNSGKTVASGMYFYNMISDKYHKIRKMLLIK
jgi:hypothetical protein